MPNRARTSRIFQKTTPTGFPRWGFGLGNCPTLSTRYFMFAVKRRQDVHGPFNGARVIGLWILTLYVLGVASTTLYARSAALDTAGRPIHESFPHH